MRSKNFLKNLKEAFSKSNKNNERYIQSIFSKFISGIKLSNIYLSAKLEQLTHLFFIFFEASSNGTLFYLVVAKSNECAVVKNVKIFSIDFNKVTQDFHCINASPRRCLSFVFVPFCQNHEF